mmetsp:Transcript_28917/g.93975  ORF Transcript_28917/g.93975 Transcript_28917/m.93975 type:complete len:226 (-) Transcript_28917:50-727(-)
MPLHEQILHALTQHAREEEVAHEPSLIPLNVNFERDRPRRRVTDHAECVHRPHAHSVFAHRWPAPQPLASLGALVEHEGRPLSVPGRAVEAEHRGAVKLGEGSAVENLNVHAQLAPQHSSSVQELPCKLRVGFIRESTVRQPHSQRQPPWPLPGARFAAQRMRRGSARLGCVPHMQRVAIVGTSVNERAAATRRHVSRRAASASLAGLVEADGGYKQAVERWHPL